jgi:NO-binding membrane sensor protein with MHYT domain/signal transduction histidine kinase
VGSRRWKAYNAGRSALQPIAAWLQQSLTPLVNRSIHRQNGIMISTELALVGSYDYPLVALSVVIAIQASYAALDLARRVTFARGKTRLLWLTGGSIAMGLGIWSMHYIGMLAFRLPIAVRYDWPTVLVSLVAAILASAVALFVVSRPQMGVMRALLGSILMGGGIAAMHYIGMEAMRMPAMCRYSTGLVALSVLLAIVISLVALWLTFHSRRDATAWSWRKASSALVMGLAIPVMHYTGMAAASFVPSSMAHHDLAHAVSVSSLSVAGIAIVTFIVLGTVVLSNLRFDSLPTTRQLAARYFVSLGVIGLLAIVGTLLIQRQGGQARTDAHVIDTAGRQRMLSQAIAKDTLLVDRTVDTAERRRLAENLRSLNSRFEQSLAALHQGGPMLGVTGTDGPGTRIFDAVEPQFNALLSASRGLVAKLSAHESADVAAEIKTVLDREDAFLQTMDAIVLHYAHEAGASNEAKNQLQFALLLSVVGGLLVQGLVVLRPALINIQRGISELELAKHALHRKATFVELLQVVATTSNEATSVDAVLQFTIDQICERTGWPIGHVYRLSSRAGEGLVPSGLWHLDSTSEFEAFRQVTCSTPLAMGAGLPGRVLLSGKPAWIPDISLDANFPRTKAILDLGVKGTFAFPVFADGAVVAVLEFFSSRIEEPDSEFLTVMSNVGVQLGQVVERTRAQEVLARKADELARSNADLEQFAYVASHDLQEPLRMVASYTQLLARRYRGKLDADADDFIGFAVDGATRMQALIQDLLSFSRVTTKGRSLQYIDAKAACDSACANLQRSIEKAAAVVSVAPLPSVLADAGQLTQLFQNLIGNAIKYRNDREPKIHVAAKPTGATWTFSVQDNGIGIDPQYWERIFQMFQRLHTRDEYSGTGIGLAICRKIVERHGGRIWVESQLGHGSTFLFTIPQTEGTTT